MSLNCALTFDFDATSVWLGSYKSRNPSMISRGEFGAVAVPRILDLLKKHRIVATCSSTGMSWFQARHPWRLPAIAYHWKS